MANIRVKDLPNTSAPAADTDEFIIDSSSAGTRRLNYGELKTAISGDFQSGTTTYKVATLGSDNKLDPAQIPDTLSQGLNFVGVANSAGDLTSTTQGDFYVIQTAFGSYNVGDQAVYDGSAYIRVTDGTKEISEGGTGATTLDAAKVNLEIIDVGTAPNEVPLNSMLSGMAYMSPDSVAMGKAEIESTTGTAATQALTVTDGTDTNFVVQEDGKTGIGTATISNKLTVEPADNDGILIDSNNDSRTGYLYFGDASSKTVGAVSYDHYSDSLRFNTAGSQRAVIDSSGRVGIGGSPTRKLELQKTGFLGSSTLGSPTDSTVSIDVRGNASTDIVQGEVLGAYTLDAYDSSGATGGGVTQNSGLHFVAGNHFGASASSVDLVFATGANGSTAERWRIDGTNGNLIANGTAIDFGSGSTLNDYEEGEHQTTATPGVSGSITLSSTHDTFAYTKIGRSIIVTGFLQVDSVSSPTGPSLYFTLPTSTLNLGDNGGSFGSSVAYYDNSSGAWSVMPCSAGESTNNLFVNIDASTVAANDQFRVMVCYQSA